MERSVKCAINIEWTNKNGATIRKIYHRQGEARLIRAESQEIFVEITAEKAAPERLLLKDVQVFNKFMSEGKSSLKFTNLMCTVFLSNAPPGPLKSFLKTMFIKLTSSKSNNLRKQVLTSLNSCNSFDEISPVTNAELKNAKKLVNKGTPSPLAKNRKRKLDEIGTPSNVKPPAAKKLYSPSPSKPVASELNEEQQQIYNACISGQNVFFTGSAGTGKSYLLKYIISALRPDVTAATASTGVAACHIGGTTLHQFAGIGTGEYSIEHCEKLALRPGIASIWRKTKHLIIDEISMVSGDYFTRLEQVARTVRNSDKPFGGIQLILCGDFFQLPPVKTAKVGEKLQPPTFCFQTKAWEECRLAVYELKTVHRQKDEKFVQILNRIRMGDVDNYVIDVLSRTSSQKIEGDGILATRLCSHTKDADIINESKLKALEGEIVTFKAQDSTPGQSKLLDSLTGILDKLELKVGAQVMLLKNINVSKGLVNGARGVVKSFRNGIPLVQFRNKHEYLANPEKWTIKTPSGGALIRKQIPLKLAWAFSIHKSQGLTLDCVEMSLGRVFEAGQAYVALSRAQSLTTLRVLDFKATQVWANPKVLQFYRSIEMFQLIPLGVKKNNDQLKVNKAKKSAKSKLFDSKPLLSIS